MRASKARRTYAQYRARRRNQVITFAEVDVDAASQDALNTAGAIGNVFGPLIARELKQTVRLDLKAAAAKAKAEAAAAIAGLQAETAPFSVSTARVDGIRLEGIAVGDAGLDLMMTATGALALQVRSIPFN